MDICLGDVIVPGTTERVLALAEDGDMNIRWRHFLRTPGGPEIPFRAVTDGIGVFLRPVWDALIRKESLSSNRNAEQTRGF